MNRVKGVLVFLYEFVIGDDPMIAAVVALALGLVAIIASHDLAVWWVLPAAVFGSLAFSLHRATR